MTVVDAARDWSTIRLAIALATPSSAQVVKMMQISDTETPNKPWVSYTCSRTGEDLANSFSFHWWNSTTSPGWMTVVIRAMVKVPPMMRSEEHTSELQSL